MKSDFDFPSSSRIDNNPSIQSICEQVIDADHSFLILIKGDDVCAYIKGDSVELADAMAGLMEEETDGIAEPLELLVELVMREQVTKMN